MSRHYHNKRKYRKSDTIPDPLDSAVNDLRLWTGHRVELPAIVGFGVDALGDGGRTREKGCEKGKRQINARGCVSAIFRRPTTELCRLRVSEDTTNHQNDCGPTNFQLKPRLAIRYQRLVGRHRIETPPIAHPTQLTDYLTGSFSSIVVMVADLIDM